MPSAQLDKIWMMAVQQAANPSRDRSLPLVSAEYPSLQAAEWGRNELYHLRKKYRSRSRKGLDPTDPAYDTSPFDRFKLRLAEKAGRGYIEVWEEDSSPTEFNLILPTEALAISRRKYSHGDKVKKSATTRPKSSNKK